MSENIPFNSDGIALDHEKKYLYYCALMGKNVYRVPVAALLNSKLSEGKLSQAVEMFATTGPNDGIAFDRIGNLYLTSLEMNAISIVGSNRVPDILAMGEEIKWPDSIAFDKEGNVFFTTSQIHLPVDKRESYKLIKISRKVAQKN